MGDVIKRRRGSGEHGNKQNHQKKNKKKPKTQMATWKKWGDLSEERQKSIANILVKECFFFYRKEAIWEIRE